MNAGDARLTHACEHIGAASTALHGLVGTRDIETAIACLKTAQYLIEKSRDTEREKRHERERDELRDIV